MACLATLSRTPVRGCYWCPATACICSAWVTYALDVVFLDRNHRVVRVVECLQPQHMVPWVRHAHQALELPTGTVQSTDTRVGDAIRFG
ncbi:MAG: DUF192 domain-containing protein [Chloroflexi bacterium]|nr:MAG: DUF192 domain-containing protein [Chloroflexota bacterium]